MSFCGFSHEPPPIYMSIRSFMTSFWACSKIRVIEVLGTEYLNLGGAFVFFFFQPLLGKKSMPID